MIVELINFMCHDHLIVDISGFGVLTASNNSGKSAIFHSIMWFVAGGTNKYIKRGENYCEVKITNGNDVISRIADGDNYTVEKNGVTICDTKASLDKIGIALPLEYFSQFDKLFLLNETPKVKADILNDMFDIENIETGFSELKKDLKDEKKELEYAENKLYSLQAKKDAIIQYKRELGHLKSEYDATHNKIELLLKIKEKLDSKCEIPDTINLDVDTSKLNLLYKIDEKLKSKLKVDEKIGLTIETEKLKLLLEIKKKIDSKHKVCDRINININTEKLDILLKILEKRIELTNLEPIKKQLNEINKKLEGSQCPICKKKML